MASESPSGDQSFAMLRPVPVEIFEGELPSAFITSMWLVPSRFEVNASIGPNGDQTGEKSLAASVVSGWSPEPSGRILRTSSWVPSKEVNATHSPSGDQRG